jgi:hypothetical protein
MPETEKIYNELHSSDIPLMKQHEKSQRLEKS